jgi:signal peptidase I
MTNTVKLELATEALTSFGKIRLPVTGSSMFPALRPGDLLEIRRTERPIQAGEVVVFEYHGRLVAHRMVGSDGDMLISRGDRLRHPDRLVPRAAILGVATAIERRGRRIAPHQTVFARMLAAVLQRTEFGTRAALYFARTVQI